MLIQICFAGLGMDYFDSLRYAWIPCMILSIICLVLLHKGKEKINKMKRIIIIALSSITLVISIVMTGILIYIPIKYNNLGVKVAAEIQDNLKNPNSLQVLGMNCYIGDGERIFFFEYTATNGFGATVRDWGMYGSEGLLLAPTDEMSAQLKELYNGYEKFCKTGDVIRINHDYVNKKIK